MCRIQLFAYWLVLWRWVELTDTKSGPQYRGMTHKQKWSFSKIQFSPNWKILMEQSLAKRLINYCNSMVTLRVCCWLIICIMVRLHGWTLYTVSGCEMVSYLPVQSGPIVQWSRKVFVSSKRLNISKFSKWMPSFQQKLKACKYGCWFNQSVIIRLLKPETLHSTTVTS